MQNNEKLLALRKDYEDVEIPERLASLVQESIHGAETELLEQSLEIKKRQRSHSMKLRRRIGSVAAALALSVGLFGVGVNASASFAEAVSDIPVLGSLARVFTIEKIHEVNDTTVTDLQIPGIEGLKDKKLQQEINDLVHRQVTAAVEETQTLMEEYKTAYLATGGTEADYVPREISVDYDVKCLDDKILSFCVYKTETLASAYFDMFYYNYDLTTSQPITLEGLLGADYKSLANAQIAAQIAERAKNPDNVYWGAPDDVEPGFTTISDDQQFYVNAAGNPVILFNKYEIAPGYMGIQEFEIVK
ncbi:MAG: DUF3298 domain-containing protein [Oscillospiraceae bacterium]